MKNLDKYIGIPFKNHGRDFNGCDCYGLVTLIYKTELDIELPDFTYNVDNVYEVLKAYKNLSKYFTEVQKPKDFDIIGMAVSENPFIVNHFGIYINGKILHTMKGINSSFITIETAKKYFNIKKVYRWLQ